MTFPIRSGLLEVAARLSQTCSWLKQEAPLCAASLFSHLIFKQAAVRPVYCIFFCPSDGLNLIFDLFLKTCLSLRTCETGGVQTECSQEEKIWRTSGRVHRLQKRRPALLTPPSFCWSIQSRSERELSGKKELVDNPITLSQLEWELATHAEGILSWDLQTENAPVLVFCVVLEIGSKRIAVPPQLASDKN